MEYVGIIIVAIFVSNIVYSQFLGICPFLGVSKKIDTAIGMGAAVAFVLAIATLLTFLLQKGVLEPLELQYLRTIVFILIIASLVQLIEIILKHSAPALYQALGVFLPLMSTNCLILGTCILVIQNDFALLPGMVHAIAVSAGFMLALIIFSGVREQLALTKIPKSMQGMPIALITAGIIAMAFMGFSGIDQVFN